MSGESDVDVEILITKVQENPAIWDKNSEDYKDRIKTMNAWAHVCRQFKENFDELPEKERQLFCKYTII